MSLQRSVHMKYKILWNSVRDYVLTGDLKEIGSEIFQKYEFHNGWYAFVDEDVALIIRLKYPEVKLHEV
jgi:hypothetical protein